MHSMSESHEQWCLLLSCTLYDPPFVNNGKHWNRFLKVVSYHLLALGCKSQKKEQLAFQQSEMKPFTIFHWNSHCDELGFQCTRVILVWFPSVNRSLWPCTADSWWEPGKNHWGPVRAWIIPLGAENPETPRQTPKAKQRLSQALWLFSCPCLFLPSPLHVRHLWVITELWMLYVEIKNWIRHRPSPLENHNLIRQRDK